MSQRGPRACVAALVAIVAATAAAYADPAPAPDVTGAPRPGDERGRIDHAEDGDVSTGQMIARGVLFLPRVLVEGVLLPVRGGVWVYDRYQLKPLWYRLFYNRDQTFGIVPTIAYETGRGLTGGAELVATDLFGHQEHLSLVGTYGGTYRLHAEGSLDTGHLLGHLVLTVGGRIDRLAQDQFYGIGNTDLGPQPSMPVDALTSDLAVKTYFRSQTAYGGVAADLRLFDGFHIIGRGALVDLTYSSPTSGTPLPEVYDPATVPGFLTGARQAYGEVEVRWDERRIALPRFELTPHTTGWLLAGFAGRALRLDQGADFTHYGVDFQAYLHFSPSPRMLVLRLWGEGVTGPTDQVPFTELPELGGDFLRGYPYARFHDRISALGTAQYVWDISRFVDAFVFVDAGRVYPSLDDLTLHDMRVGYGAGLALYDASGLLVEGSLASSIDGGVFATATLTPRFDRRPPWP